MWYEGRWWSLLLLPLSWLFLVLSRLRVQKIKNSGVGEQPFSVPVIVIGNIAVGGTGKTPLLIALCHHLKLMGFKPGVVSRGYGSNAPEYPFAIDTKTKVTVAGDEAWMIHSAAECPVVIDPNRAEAVKHLIANNDVDVILSDDGLQHYTMYRNREIAVVDGERGFGNARLLPAGPLREPVQRLDSCHWIISNGRPTQKLRQQLPQMRMMRLVPVGWHNLVTGDYKSVNELQFGEIVHAVVGIGNPQRFFSTLDNLNVRYTPHIFEDHYNYKLAEIRFRDQAPVIMTEKDAVKVSSLIEDLPEPNKKRLPPFWYLAVEAQLDPEFLQEFTDQVKQLQATNSQQHPAD